MNPVGARFRLIAQFVFCAGVLLPFASRAAETPPAPTAPRPMQLPTPVQRELANGLKMTLVEYGSVPKTTIFVTVRAGSVNQGTQVWLPDIVADMLEEGTLKRSAEQIASDAAMMGGELSIAAGAEETVVSLDVLSESLPDAVRLLAEVLREPLLPASELPRVRQNHLRNLSVIRSQAQTQAGVAFAKLLYGDHPFGQILPTEAQLSAYTVEDVRRFHNENFGAARAHVYVAGRFDRTVLESALTAAFAGWERGPEPVANPPQPARRFRAQLIDRPGSPQSTVRLGVPVITAEHPEFMALSVTNTLLGGSITSRITTNLREDKGWAYSPGSSVAARYRDAVWSESADVTTGSTGPAIAEIFKEIERLRNEPPTAAELDLVKSYRNGLFVMGTATRGGLISQLSFMNLQGLTADWLATYVQRLYAVTPEQVSAVARTQLRMDEATLVVVGDAASVRPQLEALPQLKGIPLE